MILHVSCDWCVCFARKPSEPLAMFSKAPVHLVVLGGLPASAWCPQSVWTERASASGFPTPSRIPREATGWDRFPHLPPRVVTLTPPGFLRKPCRSTAVRPHGLEAKFQVVPIRGMTQREAVSCIKALQLSCVASWHFTRLLPRQTCQIGRHARPSQTKTTFRWSQEFWKNCSKLQLYRKVSGKSWNFVWPCFLSRQILGLPPVPVIVANRIMASLKSGISS